MTVSGRDLIALAEGAVGALPAGREFRLADLVPGETWQAARVGVRRHAGTLFLEVMRMSQLVECLGRDAENHQTYRRLP